jgi:hypothetical protein
LTVAEREAPVQTELDAAWEATGVAGAVRGMVALAEVVTDFRKGRDAARAEVARLEAQIASARAALATVGEGEG